MLRPAAPPAAATLAAAPPAAAPPAAAPPAAAPPAAVNIGNIPDRAWHDNRLTDLQTALLDNMNMRFNAMDAAAAAQATAINDQTTRLGSMEGAITTQATAINDQTTRLGAMEGAITTQATAINDQTMRLGAMEGAITAQTTRINVSLNLIAERLKEMKEAFEDAYTDLNTDIENIQAGVTTILNRIPVDGSSAPHGVQPAMDSRVDDINTVAQTIRDLLMRFIENVNANLTTIIGRLDRNEAQLNGKFLELYSTYLPTFFNNVYTDD